MSDELEPYVHEIKPDMIYGPNEWRPYSDADAGYVRATDPPFSDLVQEILRDVIKDMDLSATYSGHECVGKDGTPCPDCGARGHVSAPYGDLAASARMSMIFGAGILDPRNIMKGISDG